MTGHSGSTDAPHRRPPAERLANILVGLSVLSWAVLGISTAGADRLSPVRLTITALNACVGVLFLVRSPVLRHGSLRAIVLAMPSLVVAGASLKLAPAGHLWPARANVTLAAGGAVAIVAFLSLGRSFAILPAVRRIVRGGPYALVRHPGYLGELAMVAGCCLANEPLGVWHFWPLAAAAGMVVVRILVEERVLAAAVEYSAYARRVRWRLVPGLW